MADWTIRATGTPKGQPRPRAFSRGGKARVFDPATAEGWKAAVVVAGERTKPYPPIEGPVKVSITFFMPRPRRLYRKKDPAGPMYHTSKPDRDNLEKAVLDALTEAGWWRDDCQVCAGEVKKLYHAKDDSPGATILIQELTDAP